MNDTQKILSLVLARLRWMREEGETDLRSAIWYVSSLHKACETKSADEIVAESEADDAD